jgi:small-conductance mechanosensitive channel
VLLRQQTLAKKTLAGFATRVQTEQQLAAVYANWIDLVNARAKSFLHEIFVCSLWIVAIILLVFVAHYFLKRFFAQMARERREMRTVDTVVLLSVQAVGVILILLVIFGIPGNFATVLALAGAGLTVALKDFIVGFLGWFVLMGKDGIRVGDWVEINGVGGEVLKLGPLHTVVLETGNWTDAGHPTGRKVSFVNSFAIEGHYFNFSTSGQWLWDEIELQVPAGVDPYAMAEAIQEIAAHETAQNAQLAESEWNRVTASRSFHATPSLSVRPSSSGISVQLRYITRANERFEVRARLYRAIVELLQKKTIPEVAISTTGPKAVSEPV